MKANDMSSALRLFDARKQLFEWAENHWHERNGGSREDLLTIMRKTKPVTTEADLDGWSVRKVTEQKEVPDTRSSIAKFFKIGKPPEPQVKEVGRVYTKA